MKSKKHYHGNISKSKHTRKPHPNTNLHAWNKVAEESKKYGYSKREMSKRYREIDRQDTFKEAIKSLIQPPKIKTTSKRKQSVAPHMARRYVPKRTILDDLREYRSSKIIASASNVFAEFIVKTTAQELNNSQKNILRSAVALAISESLNKAFEKKLDAIAKVQTYIKVGKFIYKVILWYDKETKTYRTDCHHIKKVPPHSLRYNSFLIKHPNLKKIYKNKSCLTLEEIKAGKSCFTKEQLDRYNNLSIDNSLETPNGCPYYYYCH